MEKKRQKAEPSDNGSGIVASDPVSDLKNQISALESQMVELKSMQQACLNNEKLFTDIL